MTHDDEPTERVHNSDLPLPEYVTEQLSTGEAVWSLYFGNANDRDADGDMKMVGTMVVQGRTSYRDALVYAKEQVTHPDITDVVGMVIDAKNCPPEWMNRFISMQEMPTFQRAVTVRILSICD